MRNFRPCIDAIGLLALFLTVLAPMHAQNGGKVEPKRISFAAGATRTRIVGRLRNGQQTEYIFAAEKGRSVTVENSTSSRFDFRVFDDVNFSEGDFDSSPTYTFEVPETGDYLFTVRKKVAGPRSARFSISISIKESIK